MQGREESQFYNYINDCHRAPYPGIDWTPSPQQMRKVLYREAAGSRIFGDFARALNSITSALDIVPGDVKLEGERQRILQAMG